MKRSILILGSVLSIVVGFIETQDEAQAQGPVTEFDQFDLPEMDKELTEDLIFDNPKPKKPYTPSEKHIRAEKLLAAMMFGECRGQGAECMHAVGHVAMNRARLNLDKRYGRGLSGVVLRHKAFSCFLTSDPNKKVIDRALAGKLNPNTQTGKMWDLAVNISNELMHNPRPDPTNGSTHYHAPYVNPKWANDRGMVRQARIAGHIFYKFG